MRNKRILVSLMAGLVVFSLTACNIGKTPPAPLEPTVTPVGQIPSASTDAGSATSGSCSNSLYPVVQGATWTYAVSGSPKGNFTYTDTITEVRADGFTVTTDMGGVTRTQEWKCTSDGLLALSVEGGNAVGLSSEGLSAEFTTSNATGVTVPATTTPGMQWNYGLDLQGTISYQGQSADATGSVNTPMQEAGTESVSVPAGDFNATKVQATPTFKITATYHGLGIPITLNGNSTLWYAPGVGLVKSTESGNVAGESLSATTELQSYNIP